MNVDVIDVGDMDTGVAGNTDTKTDDAGLLPSATPGDAGLLPSVSPGDAGLLPFVSPVDVEATVVKVYDGDTLTLTLPIPTWTSVGGVLSATLAAQEMKCRVIGLDAPEVTLRGKTTEQEKRAGRLVRDHVRSFLTGGAPVLVKCRGIDLFGRLLVDVRVQDPGPGHPLAGGKSLSEYLLERGFALPFVADSKGRIGSKKEWTPEALAAICAAIESAP